MNFLFTSRIKNKNNKNKASRKEFCFGLPSSGNLFPSKETSAIKMKVRVKAKEVRGKYSFRLKKLNRLAQKLNKWPSIMPIKLSISWRFTMRVYKPSSKEEDKLSITKISNSKMEKLLQKRKSNWNKCF